MTRFGFQIPAFDFEGVADDALFEHVAAIAVAAEQSGFDSLWLMDHVHQIGPLGTPDDRMLEAYTLLSAIAARTERADLGVLVTGVTHRNPALLAKMVTTLDVVSGGRAMLGIGAAWFQGEDEAYGYGEFPPPRERLDRLEEAVQVCRAMFTSDPASFAGTHYRIDGARNVPRPLRPGGPPILIGGGGERRTLRMVAEHADWCNLFGSPDDVRHKLGVLERHCADVGRDSSTITKTWLGTVVLAERQADAERKRERMRAAWGIPDAGFDAMVKAGDPDAVTEQIAAYLDAGLDGVMINMPGEGPELVGLAGRTLSTRLG